MTQPEKRCPRCDRNLPVTRFNVDRGRRDGLASYCRDCKVTPLLPGKWCRKCERRLPEDRFGRQRNGAIRRLCVDCHKPSRKRCADCGQVKAVSEFHRQTSSSDGYQYYCKPCGTQTVLRSHRRLMKEDPSWRAVRRERYRLYYQKNRERFQDRERMRKYGLSPEQYRAMVAAQDGKCANTRCLRPLEHVDHRHSTGAVRGLLCHPCNVSFGLLDEDPGLLAGGAVYLARHNADWSGLSDAVEILCTAYLEWAESDAA